MDRNRSTIRFPDDFKLSNAMSLALSHIVLSKGNPMRKLIFIPLAAISLAASPAHAQSVERVINSVLGGDNGDSYQQPYGYEGYQSYGYQQPYGYEGYQQTYGYQPSYGYQQSYGYQPSYGYRPRYAYSRRRYVSYGYRRPVVYSYRRYRYARYHRHLRRYHIRSYAHAMPYRYSHRYGRR